MNWPSTQGEFQKLAQMLLELVCGRRDVAARYYEFKAKDTGELVKGWSPWKGKKVAPDYEAAPDELVLEYKAKDRRGFDSFVMRKLDVAALVTHLRGKERLGVYPLTPDGMTRFIAADFDDHEGTLQPDQVWAEVRRFVEVCEFQDFMPIVERSRSMRGYHVWLFFDAPVNAGEARALGRWLFEESQLLRDEEDFSTFDRFFPAQARLSKRGLGNLIALPMCGGVNYANGSAAWIDDNAEVIPDAIERTRWILEKGRNPAARVSEFLRENGVKPDDTVEQAREARDPDRPLDPPEDLEAVVERCAFMRHASTPATAAVLTYDQWVAMISVAARFSADDWIHKASEAHAKYSPTDTEAKIAEVRANMMGPWRCSTIQDKGFGGCPRGGCRLPNNKATRSPAGLSVWANVQQAAPSRSDGSVRMDGHQLRPAPDRGGADPGEEWPWAKEKVENHPDTGLPWPKIYGSFVIDADGVHMPRGEDKVETISLSPIWIDALTFGTSSNEQGVNIRFFDRTWKLRSQAVQSETMYEHGNVLAKLLASQGALVLPGKEKWVSRYLVVQQRGCARRVQSTSRLGWITAQSTGKLVFVLPDQVIGSAENEIVYQSDLPLSYAESMRAEGTLLQWQEQVAKRARGNPLLMFALMIGLAGPLMRPCEEQGGGFHYYGTTTGGKTTCAQVAMSVWGNAADPANDSESTAIRKWDATVNAMEGIAELHSHQLLALDEIGQTDIQDVGQAIYKLAGGKGKERSTINGGLRKPRSWRTLIFSNGEVSLHQTALKAQQALKGGQLLRIVDIPVDKENGERGIVEKIWGTTDTKVFVEDLKSSCAKFYGSAGPALVRWLLAEYAAHGTSIVVGQLKDELKMIEEWLAKQLTGSGGKLPPEGRRVLRRFALVALAGGKAGPECAKVIDWSVAEVMEATLAVAKRWLDSIGNERSEADRGVAQLRENMIENIGSFPMYDIENAPQRVVLGYRYKDHEENRWFLVMPQALATLCGDYDTRLVVATLRERNLMKSEGDRRTCKCPGIPSLGGVRPAAYWISATLLGEDVTEAERIAERQADLYRRKGSSLL